MDISKNSHIKDQFTKRLMVWYEGTDAVQEGEAFCFEATRGVATDKDGTRSSVVIRPTAAVANFFAGVAARDYTAKSANSPGQFIELNGAGSRGVNVFVKSGVDTTVAVTNLTFEHGGATPGQFVINAADGQGSAIATQTVTGGGKVQADLSEGVQAGGVAG